MSADESNSASPPGPPRNLTRRALGGLFWTFSGTGVQGVVQLLVIMALARLLSPAEFGLMGAATVVIVFSQFVSQLGVGPAIVQRRELHPVHLRVAFTLSGVMGLLLGAVVWLSAGAIAGFYRIPAVEPVLQGLALLFPIEGLNTVGKSLLMRELRFRQFVALDVASYIVGFACVGVALAWQGYGVWALVAANLGQSTLRTVTMYLATAHPVRPSVNLRAGGELLSYGVGQSLAQIGQVISQQADNLVVGRWLGPTALGIYGRAYSLMVMPAAAFGRIVNRVLFPLMAQVQDDRERLAGAYERAIAIVALVSLPTSAFLLIVAPEFIGVVLGPAWTAVVLPFQLFAFSLILRMSSMICDALTKAAGAVYARAARQGVFAALVFVGALIGQRWGVAGVAVAVSIAMAINFLSMAQLSRSVTGLSNTRFVRAHVPAVVLAALIGAVSAPVAGFLRGADAGTVSVLLITALAAIGAGYAGTRLSPRLFLGPHGAWVSQHVGEFLLRAPRRLAGYRAAK